MTDATMDTLDTSEPYYRVQSQISFDGSTEDEQISANENKSSVNYGKCLNDSHISPRSIRIFGTISIIALLLSLGSVAMVTLHLTNIIETTMCSCPLTTVTSHGKYIPINDIERVTQISTEGNDSVTGSLQIPDHSNLTDAHFDTNMDDMDCPTCRVRRDGQRRKTNGRRTRQRKCNRVCQAAALSHNSMHTAIHFHGFPPGKYRLGQDGVYVWWRPASWYSHMPPGFHYNHTSGHVTIRKTGIYHIYSQMVHTQNLDQTYAITINDSPFIMCAKSSPTVDHITPNESSCYTGGVTLLKKNDRVWIKGIHTNGDVILRKESTFWGIIKLSMVDIE